MSVKSSSIPIFTISNCPFLSEQQKTIDEFRASLKNGILTLAKNSQPPRTVFGKIWNWIRPPIHFGNENVIRICKIWERCTASLVHHNGVELQKSLNDIIKERKTHPKEFHATLPRMNSSSIDKTIRLMRASAFLFLTFDAARKENVQQIRLYINKAVEWYLKAGIKEVDSLKSYQKVVLDHADILEQFQDEMCKGHTGRLLG